MKKVIPLLTLFVLSVIVNSQALAQDRSANSGGDTAAAERDEPNRAVGLLFNSENVLLDLDDYQGGVGLKVVYPRFAIRGVLGFAYEHDSETSAIAGGITFEKPIVRALVTPYWGAMIRTDYSRERNETDADNWIESATTGVVLGPIFGGELTITNNLGVFAEYQLVGRFSRTKIETSTNGATDTASNRDLQFGTELGNQGSIGIVVYLGESR